MAGLPIRIACVLLLSACASTAVVHTDHAPGTDFSRYATYAWREEPATQSPLVRQRLVAAIEAQLQGKGWRKVPEAEADTMLAVHVATREEQHVDDFYTGSDWEGWRWHGVQGAGVSHAAADPATYDVGTLVIDLFDARARQAIWRATAEGVVPDTPQGINAAIDATVPRMFEDFPPGGR